MSHLAALSNHHPGVAAHDGTHDSNPGRESAPAAVLLQLLADRIHLSSSLDHLRTTFNEAKPFRHVVLDDLFPDAMLNRVLNEVPALTRDNFVVHHDSHQTKFGLRSAIGLKEEGFQFAAFLHSAAFLYLLSEITGIWGLLPDPYMQGGGYHVIPEGGKFDIHIDRKTDYATGLRRRLAFITYLNKDWKPEYGGQLELWNAEGTRCEASVEPVFNRTILFEVADKNYHGHPNPIAAPEGRPRKSFAVYYHTIDSDDRPMIDMRSSLFAPTIHATAQEKAKAVVRDLVPPILIRGLRGLVDKKK